MAKQSHWLIIALVLALSAGVRADILDSLSHYRTAIRMRMGFATTSTAMSDTMLNTMIRLAVVRVNDEIKGYRVERTITLSGGVSTYNLDSTITPLSVDIRRSDSSKSLAYVPRPQWSEQAHQQTIGQKDWTLKRPSYFDYIDGKLFIGPPPWITDTVKIVGLQQVRNLQSVVTLTQIPERYRELIYLRALTLVASSRQHPYTGLFLTEYEAAKRSKMEGLDAAKAAAAPAR